jgi:hypothetical protein
VTLPAAERLDLTDLVHRYAARVDDRDPAGVAALFTHDGVLASPRPPRDLDPVDEATGAVEIAAALQQLSGTAVTQHAVVGLVLDAEDAEDAGGASGRVACIAHHVLPDGTDLVWHLTYRDRYRRTAAGWRFVRRALHVDVVERRHVTTARGLVAETAGPSR